MADWFAVYERLWALIQEENVFLEYQVLDIMPLEELCRESRGHRRELTV